MTDPTLNLRTNQGRQRKGFKCERAMSRRRDVQGQPLPSQRDVTQPLTTTIIARGVEQMTVQDAAQASLSNLPRRETGLTPAAARRGGKLFRTAMPLYEPPTKEVAEYHQVSGSKSLTSLKSRDPGLSLRHRRNEGRNLDVLIVTEFMIAYKDPYPFEVGFIENVSRVYNEAVPLKYPRMSRWPEMLYPPTMEKWKMFEERDYVSFERLGTASSKDRKHSNCFLIIRTKGPDLAD